MAIEKALEETKNAGLGLEVIHMTIDFCEKYLLPLLREQEAVKPERECSGGGTTWWNVCGACRTAINPNDKYCHECGRKVKWDDA